MIAVGQVWLWDTGSRDKRLLGVTRTPGNAKLACKKLFDEGTTAWASVESAVQVVGEFGNVYERTGRGWAAHADDYDKASGDVNWTEFDTRPATAGS